MTILLLVRHGDTDALGRILCGRKPGWHLNETGRRQVNELAQVLSPLPVAAMYSSPLERTMETAQILASSCKTTVEAEPLLNEIDFGDWAGCTFEQLSALPEWHKFNASKSSVTPPRGESMLQVQARVRSAADKIRSIHPFGTVIVVSHSDPIRLLAAHHLGMPLDAMTRFRIDPASVSQIELHDGASVVACLNYKVHLTS